MTSDQLTLRPFSNRRGNARCHAIFIHGLSGDPIETWAVGPKKKTIAWPLWLEEDIEGLRTWTVGYPASAHAWRKGALPILDRGRSVLNRLLHQPELKTGTIVLIGHSMGGLIAKQILQTAESQGRLDTDVAAFGARIRAVAFLGTPHVGSFLASVARWIPFRRSAAVDALVNNDPAVRSLDDWFRSYRDAKQLLQLNMLESRAPRVLGVNLPGAMQVVPLGSGSAVAGPSPITVDCDHFGICKPSSVESPIYLNVRQLLIDAMSEEMLARQAARSVANTEKEASQRTLTNLVDITTITARLDPALIDDALSSQINTLRRIRFFNVPAPEKISQVADSIEKGQYSAGSRASRAWALAWCARLIVGSDPETAIRWCLQADSLSPTAEASIARGLGNMYSARSIAPRSELVALGTPEAMGAALLATWSIDGPEDTLAWIEGAGINVQDVDSDGRFAVMQCSFAMSKWNVAATIATSLTDSDFDRTPALLKLAADAYMALTLPTELRHEVLAMFPHTTNDIPFGARPEDSQCLESARRLYLRAAEAARALNLTNESMRALERAYGIEILQPGKRDAVLAVLRTELGSPSPDLRLLALALRHISGLDTSAIDADLDRRVALLGRSSMDIAQVRHYVTLSKPTPGDRLAHFQRHRNEMAEYFGEVHMASVEMALLTEVGRKSDALACLERVRQSITPDSYDRLLLVVSKEGDVSDVELLKERFDSTSAIGDLQLLCNTLRSAGRWGELAIYARLLHERTNSVRHLELLADALYASTDLEGSDKLLDQHVKEVSESTRLQRIACLTAYASGRFKAARVFLDALRSEGDAEEYRQLHAALLIASGDWEALEGHVNLEWENRENRSASELARTASLGLQVASARTNDLVREAASRSEDSAETLIACYTVATQNGLDHLSEVSSWLQRAAELSKEGSGPVQSVEIEALLSLRSQWDENTQNVRRMLIDAAVPMSIAAKQLNNTLVQMIIQTGLANKRLSDASIRAPIYACSGNEKPPVDTLGRVGIDVTALLELELLDALDVVIQSCESFVIPHGTLAWLFDERAKVKFHQPSRIENARLVRRMIAEGDIAVFTPEVSAEPSVAGQVGEVLAQMLAAAESGTRGGSTIRVLHGAPIYGLGSLMKVEADVTAYASVLVSCQGLVRSMHINGLITGVTLDQYLSFLTFVEEDWPTPTEVPQGTTLLVDDTAMSRLLHLQLLGELANHGYSILVDAEYIAECDALIRHEAQVNETLDHIDHLRRVLRDGLASGALMAASQGSESIREEGLRRDPSVAMLSLIGTVDRMIIGDRYLNRLAVLATSEQSTPVADVSMVLDLLHREGLVQTDSYDHQRAIMRRSGFFLIPVLADELLRLTTSCTVRAERVVETAELRALAENLLQIRANQVPIIPAEGHWYDNLFGSGLECIVRTFEIRPPEQAFVIATWVWEQVDPMLWAYCLARGGIDASRLRDSGLLRLVLSIGKLKPELRHAAHAWLDAAVLETMARTTPVSFNWLCDEIAKLMKRIPVMGQGVEEDDE